MNATTMPRKGTCKDCGVLIYKVGIGFSRCVPCLQRQARARAEVRANRIRFKRCKTCGEAFSVRPGALCVPYCTPKCASKAAWRIFKKPAKVEADKISREMKDYNKKMYGTFVCSQCQTPQQYVDVHHIIFRSEVPNHLNLHNPRNLLIVCRACHNIFHGEDAKQIRVDLIIERRLWELFPKHHLESKVTA